SRLQHHSATTGPKRQLLNSLNLQPIDAGSHHHQTDDGSHSDNGESGNEMCIKTEDLIIDDDDASSRQCADDDLGTDSNDKATSACSTSANKSGEPNTVVVEGGAQRTNGTTRSIGTVPSLSSISTMRTVPSGSSRGSIRVKSIENLFENYQAKHQSPKSSRDARRKNMPQSSVRVLGCGGASENDSASEQQQQAGGIASSLMYNRNEMDIYVTQQRISKATERHSSSAEGVGDETNASTASDGDGYENIICSPNFPQLSEVVGGYKAEEDDEEEEYGEEYAIQLLAEEIDSSMLANGGESEGDEILYKPPPLMAIAGGAKGSHSGNGCANNKSSGLRTYGRVGAMGVSATGASSTLTIRKIERNPRANLNVSQARTVNRRSKLTGRSKEALHQLLNTNGAPPPIAFTLRNPRGNQPRTYNTEALWAALMDVKAGESIYRASQMHKVPRKTLRNWMKRWDIKSAYPMPRQLKEAAEKKRIIKELTSQIQ
uniref:HTH psq-type domain-containing protein n=1 Tax=Anopheles maculatus TaxID=74869 RepID=A0A182T8M2_9DIPT